jgi:hypothetical protein
MLSWNPGWLTPAATILKQQTIELCTQRCLLFGNPHQHALWEPTAALGVKSAAGTKPGEGEDVMTTGYRYDRGVSERAYSEKDYFFENRFYPGELGMVVLTMLASLLLWAVAIYGITHEPRAQYNNVTTGSPNNAY